jgi:hypothetical protein
MLRFRKGDIIPAENMAGEIIYAEMVGMPNSVHPSSYLVKMQRTGSYDHFYMYPYDTWFEDWVIKNPDHPFAQKYMARMEKLKDLGNKKIPHRMMDEYVDRKKKSAKPKPKRKIIKKCKCK